MDASERIARVSAPSPGDLAAISLSVLDGVDEGVVVLDRDWVYRYVNPAGAAILGTTVAELLGGDHRRLYPETQDTAFYQAYVRVMQSGAAETIEEHYQPRDRFLRHRVLPWADGGVVVVFSDVTEERAARERTDRELEVLRQVIDHADVMIALKDLDGRYRLTNRALARVAGRTPEEMVGATPYEVFPPEIADVMATGDREVIRSKAPHHREEAFPGPRGSVRTFLTVRFPAYDLDGGLSGSGVIYTDVTALRATEDRLAQALQASAETVALLETLQRSAPVGFAFMDRDYRFVRVNEAMAALNGLPVEDHIGRPVSDVVPALWPRLESLYEQVLETGRSITDVDLSGETPARPGEHREWLVSFYPVVTEGGAEPIGIGALAHEVTAQRRLEARLRQAQKMEAVGQLAGGIAHDFNNVLAAVTLTAELCLPEAPAGTLHDGLARILASARSATRLTQQLLVFSRQQRVSLVPVDVAQAVQGVREILDRTLGDDIRLSVRMRPVPPVLLDPSQLEQIVLNLAINARDAMPGGGRLTLATDLVVLGTADLTEAEGELLAGGRPLAAGRYVELRVGDTGTGMTAEVRDRAAEPFFTTKSGQGTGLGLATVYGIVQSAGGALALDSTPGHGTVVRILLPVAEAAAEAPGPRSRSTVPGAGQRVLVVEDQADLRDAVVEVLGAAGYDVATLGADELLARLDDVPPVDLLVTDVVMPGVSGPQLAAAVTTTWPGTRVLYVSGYTDGLVDAPGLTGGGHRLLGKPFTSAALLAAVAESLQPSGSGDG